MRQSKVREKKVPHERPCWDAILDPRFRAVEEFFFCFYNLVYFFVKSTSFILLNTNIYCLSQIESIYELPSEGSPKYPSARFATVLNTTRGNLDKRAQGSCFRYRTRKRFTRFSNWNIVIFNCQVTTLLNRERQLLQERKLVNREFERLKLEKSRPGSNRIREPPQRLSDLLSTPGIGVVMHEPPVRLDLMSPRDDGGYSRELDGIGSRTIFNGLARDRVILWRNGTFELNLRPF